MEEDSERDGPGDWLGLLDCGHRQKSFGSWWTCLHPLRQQNRDLRRGGFSGCDFLSVPLEGNALCAACRRRYDEGLGLACVSFVCGSCAFDRLLSVKEVAS